MVSQELYYSFRFLRTSPLVQFSERVVIIKTVGDLLHVPVLQHLHGMAMVWLPYVDKQMEIHRKVRNESTQMVYGNSSGYSLRM